MYHKSLRELARPTFLFRQRSTVNSDPPTQVYDGQGAQLTPSLGNGSILGSPPLPILAFASSQVPSGRSRTYKHRLLHK